MNATIRDLMTSHVITLNPEDDLMKADAIMKRGRIRHLPVTNCDKLVGLITSRDLLSAQIAALGNATTNECTTLTALPASENMRTNVLTTSPDSEPAAVARMMLQHKVGCVPVVEDDKLVGILTEADFVRWALETSGRAAA